MDQKTDNLTAEDIADHLLYKTGQALAPGRFHDPTDCFILPNAVETPEGVRILRTPDDVRRVFEGVRAYFESCGVVDLVRTVVEAKFTSEDTIESTHVARLLKSGGQAFRAPYPAYSVLKRCDDGAWRIASTTYAIVDSRKHNEAFLAWRSKDDTADA